MRLTLEEAKKFIAGKQRQASPPKRLVVPLVQTDPLGVYARLDLPILIVSEPNTRGLAWHGKAKRARNQQNAIAFWADTFRHVRLPQAVGLVRIAPGKLDGDNLQASFKAVRDAIARIYGRDDADWKANSISWSYEQMSQGRLYGVRIAVQGNLL